MEDTYPLKCSFCGEKELPTKRSIYSIEISEINYNPKYDEVNDKTYPHECKSIRHLQICGNCLEKSDIQKALLNENRPIEFGNRITR